MVSRIVLNTISYHGKGAIESIADEAKGRRAATKKLLFARTRTF